MKVIDIFKAIEKDNSWSYYKWANVYLDTEGIFSYSIFNDGEAKALDFIERYFNAGGKAKLLSDISYEIKELPRYRCNHIVSAFLLGIYVRNSVGINIEKFEDTCAKDPWLYIWYLVCLYHDLGYVYENNSQDNKYKLFEDFLPQNNRALNSCKQLHYYDLGKRYFQYRRDSGVIDHGVVGGFRLYSILYDVINNKRKKSSPTTETELDNRLIYSMELRPMQKEAADAIVRHNMFVANKNQEIEYKQRGMDILIPNESNTHLISLKKEPFAFLLGLIDTIEPIKRFQHANHMSILKDIDIDVREGTIQIQASTYFNLEDYFRGIDCLDKWLNVKIEKKDGYKRTIEIIE